MPLIEAGFRTEDGNSDSASLIQHGPTIVVLIGHHPSDHTPPEIETVHALIDTGAGHSCIDNTIAEKLKLPVVDTCSIAGVSGANDHPVYMAHIQFPALNFSEYGRFTGVDLQKGGQPHGALLGRTFLRYIVMIYDGIRAQVTIACPHIP